MGNSSQIIVDTSVFGKWYLNDEQDREPALHLQYDYLRGRISIVLPSIALDEVGNLFKSSVKRLRIDKQVAVEAYKEFLDSDFFLHTSHDLLNMSIVSAIELDISFYDASYVVLAEHLHIPFYTSDERLVKKVKSTLVISLKEYPKTQRFN